MKILSCSVTALLLAGSVSLATATPHKERGPTGRTSYTEEPAEAPSASPDSAPPAWVELATPTPCAHGRTFVTVDDDTVAVSRLRIDAHQGLAVIKGVKVKFKDGKQRYVKLAKRLDARGQKSAYIDLRGGHELDSFVVDSDWRAKGSYTVHGEPARGKAIATR